MKRTVRVIVVLTLAVSLSGCMNFIIEGDAWDKSKCRHHEVVHGSLYGIEWSDWNAGKECGSRMGFYKVRYHTNLLYALVSLFTLGLYVPQSVEWWCQGPQETSEKGGAKKESEKEELFDFNKQ